MKRIACMLLAFCVFLAMPYGVGAKEFRGFSRTGTYSDSKVPFCFETYEAVIVYNGDSDDDPDFYHIWPTTAIYVPIYRMGDSGQDDALASDKEIKDNQVEISWKARIGGKYIDDVVMVSGKKEKVDGIASGTYARIKLNDDFAGPGSAAVELDVVLSVKKVSYPATMITLRIDLNNRQVIIKRNTVYAAQSPTQFYSLKTYAGPVTFDFGDKIKYHTEVEKSGRYYLHLDQDEDPALAAQYPDAYLEYYNFKGNRDTFPKTGTLEIPINRAKFTPKKAEKAQVFVYEVVDGTLKALDERVLSFDSKSNTLSLRTKTLGYYVLSDTALHREVNDGDDDIIFVGYASQNAESADDSSSTAGDVPEPVDGSAEEAAPVNDNVNTGRIINADNNATDNPLTAGPPVKPFVALGLLAGAVALLSWKRGLLASWSRS